MKKLFVTVMCAAVVMGSWAQEAKRIDITGFEDLGTWAYTGGGVIESYVDFPGDFGIPAHEGEVALLVNYEFAASYPWSWNQINFVQGAIDLTGMREIHMWVYFEDGAVGDLSIRLDVGGGSLGTQTAPGTGAWHELVWNIDRLTSDTRINSVSSFGGFLAPGSGGAAARVWIDEIFAVRPTGIVELEQVLVYGFNEEDPDTLAPVGWGAGDGEPPFLGQGDVTPSEGTNYMECALGGGWIVIARTTNAMEAFDRWTEVQEIMVDACTSTDYTGSWVQSDLVLQSSQTGWDGQGKEIGFSGFTTSWKTLLWGVDMSKHKDAFTAEGGWFSVGFTSNNDASQQGARVFYDNFRVSVPKGGPVNVGNWSLF